MANHSLKRSRDTKNDEFFTRLDDIENELSKYDAALFKDKTVYCNCDDPTWSNFFRFFMAHGRDLGIKQVHFTNYANTGRVFGEKFLSAIELAGSREDDRRGIAHHWIFTPADGNVVKSELKGDGDFMSDECLDILDRSDILITNPPFSLLTEYLKAAIDREKKFLVIGNENEIASRSWCSYFEAGKIWLGYTHPKQFTDINGGVKKLGFICWFTNLEVAYRNEPLALVPRDLSEFKRYDNYDAIEIPKTKLIPDNYYGNMGVPIFFVEKFCPKQFDIVDTTPAYGAVPKISGKKVYRRIIIKRKP